MQRLYNIHSIINHNVHNNYRHWLHMSLFFWVKEKVISAKYINLVATHVKMFYYNTINVSEGMEINKSNKSK